VFKGKEANKSGKSDAKDKVVVREACLDVT
jgi:hypothetical protein